MLKISGEVLNINELKEKVDVLVYNDKSVWIPLSDIFEPLTYTSALSVYSKIQILDTK